MTTIKTASNIPLPPSAKKEDLSEMSLRVINMPVNKAFAFEGEETLRIVRGSISTARKRDNSVSYATRRLKKELVEEFGLTYVEGAKYYGVWRLPNVERNGKEKEESDASTSEGLGQPSLETKQST